MPELPLVSIAAINYNNARYLRETLDSIAAQDYQHTELIVVDDCSTDNSVELIEAWLANFKGTCRFIKHEQNKGVCAACNSGLRNASGKYFSLIATDDVMEAEKTSVQVALLESTGDQVAGVYSDASLIDEHGGHIDGGFIQRHRQFEKMPTGNIYEVLLQKNFIPAMTVLLKKEIIDALGGYDEALIYEDYDMWLRIAQRYELVYSDFVSCKYRIRPGSLTFSIRNWEYSNTRIFLKHTDGPLPMKWVCDTAWGAYMNDDKDTMPLVRELAIKTGNRQLMTIYSLWKFAIPQESSEMIMTAVNQQAEEYPSASFSPDDTDIKLMATAIQPRILRNMAHDAYTRNTTALKRLCELLAIETNDKYIHIANLLWRAGAPPQISSSILSGIGKQVKSDTYEQMTRYSNDGDALVNEVTPLIPANEHRLHARSAYFSNNLLLQPLIRQLEKSGGDFYLKAILDLWKSKIDRHAGAIILERIAGYLDQKKNGLYIRLCLYKDIRGAIKAGNVSSDTTEK